MDHAEFLRQQHEAHMARMEQHRLDHEQQLAALRADTERQRAEMHAQHEQRRAEFDERMRRYQASMDEMAEQSRQRKAGALPPAVNDQIKQLTEAVLALRADVNTLARVIVQRRAQVRPKRLRGKFGEHDFDLLVGDAPPLVPAQTSGKAN